MDEYTVVDLLAEAQRRIDSARRNDPTLSREVGRNFSLAITALEDAQMRYTRGRAMQEDKFAPADLDR